MFSFNKTKQGFSYVPQDSNDDTERDGMLEHHEKAGQTSASKTFWRSNVPWMLSTLALSIYIVVSGTYHRTNPIWSPTDFAPARPFMEEIVQKFTSGLDYNSPNQTLQHTPAPGPRYVGKPSLEIDVAWKNIAGIQEVYLTREEAIAAKVDDTYRDPLTKLYEVEIEGFHHLHCLNYIRKSLDLDRYPDIQSDTQRIHVEHCINSIREFIMCKADMTPIVLIPPETSGIPVPIPEFRTTHICRNFAKLHNWVQTERSANGDNAQALELARKIRAQTGTKY